MIRKLASYVSSSYWRFCCRSTFSVKVLLLSPLLPKERFFCCYLWEPRVYPWGVP